MGLPPMSKRRTHSPKFKARVAMEAISGRKTIQEIAADHAIHHDVTPFIGPGLMRVGGCGHAAAPC